MTIQFEKAPSQARYSIRSTNYHDGGGTAETVTAHHHGQPTTSPTATAMPSYFDVAAEKYMAWYYTRSPQGYALNVRQQRVLELLDKPGGKLLDVGCGPAIIANELLKSSYEVWGIDAAPHMIDLCRKRYEGVARAHFSIGEATRLSFINEYFDAAICMGVLDRVQSHEAALQEMLRVVKRDGTLVLTFPNLLSPYAAWKNYIYYPTLAFLRPIYYALARKPQPPSLYSATGRVRLQSLLTSFATMQTVKTFTGFMEQNGAKVTDVAYSNFNVFLSPLDEVFPKFALRVTRRMEALRGGMLKWLGAGFIFKVKKLG